MKITHHFGGGVYVKETHFDAGEGAAKHVHDYDHLSTLVCGTVQLTTGNEKEVITGPKVIVIKAGITHEVRAITPAIWHCTHASETALIGEGE
jgi:quercetin dioxygenase-like cupin family protein